MERFGLLLKKVSYYCICLVSIFQSVLSQVSSPKQEIRAVWITTVNGLDWPHSYSIVEQQRSLLEIIEKLHAANFNTIYFQARGRADAMYHSEIEPWSAELTGVLGKDPGWDPLQFVIREGHARCMEVHVWFNTFLVKTSSGRTPLSVPRHITLQHPLWVHNLGEETWLDPGLPEVRAYTVRVVIELLKNYDVDGIQFDYTRYPIKQLPDEETYRRYGGSTPKPDWRRENINLFMRMAYDAAVALKPMIKIGSAPIGIYNGDRFKATLHSYEDLYQDSRRWLREGKNDYVVPQVYWSLGSKPNNPDFAEVVREWSTNVASRQLVIGVGAYKTEVAAQLPLLIDTTRFYHLAGNSFFRYSNIADKMDLAGRYAYPANIPPMPWRDSLPPMPPRNFSITRSSFGTAELKWDEPLQARDGGGVKVYNIYRSSSSPVDITRSENLLAIQASGKNFFIDSTGDTQMSTFYYEVTALDVWYNESAAASAESVLSTSSASVTVQSRLGLFEVYPNPAVNIVFIAYEVPEQAHVRISVFDKHGREVMSVVHGQRPVGRHLASARVAELSEGVYTMRLLAGSSVAEQKFSVQH